MRVAKVDDSDDLDAFDRPLRAPLPQTRSQRARFAPVSQHDDDESVEAMFFVDCAEGDPNVQYSAADGHGPAGSCHEAKATAIAAHRAFLQAFRLDERRFPLLKLRPADWKAPFVIARSIDTVGSST